MSEQFIEPCPFCNDQMLEFVQTPDGCAKGDGKLWVVCDHCGAMGGTGDSVDSAIAGWNRRATQPQAPQSERFVSVHIDEYDRLGCCRRLLEIIAVGDSDDPKKDAADELVAHGFWDRVPDAASKEPK